jgi:predicted branched-subunit amino acid permease
MRPIVRDALGIGIATGAYGLSFGALAVAAGLSLPQACALSLLMFTGASQFAFVGLIGGGAAAAVATALLLGARNALYGLRLAPHLRPRPLAAHLVIDESAAMAVRDTPADTRLGFWSTGAAVFVFWNLATLLGALAGQALSDPRALGLDAAAPAAFLALLAPRLREREPQTIAALAAVAALLSVPLVPAGTPVLVAAAVAMVAALARRGEGGAEPARHGIEPARGGA